MKLSRMFQFLPLAGLLAIAGCSSSSDGDGATSTVSGSVTKGVIINGVVKAYKIINGGIDTVVAATGTTDNKGKYSIIVENHSGPIHIVVSAGPDSKMKCDRIGGCDTNADGTADADFGDLIDMPAAMTLEAVLPNVSGGEVQGSVNSLTHLAAAYAKATATGEAGMQTLGIQAAIDRVEKLFGVSNILTAAIDLTDETAVGVATANDFDALKIAFISAAIAKIAGDEYNGDFVETLNKLTTNFTSKNGELLNNLSSQEGKPEDTLEITLFEIIEASIATMDSPDVKDNSVLDDGIYAEFTSKENETISKDGIQTETVIEIESNDLAAAKNIVQTVRTWANQLQTLSEKGELFTDEYDMTQQMSQLAMNSVGDGLLYATGSAGIAYAWSNHLASPITQSIAGKTITFDKNTEDELTFTFTCDGKVVDNNMGGDYLANGGKLYIWLKSDENYIAQVPSGVVSVGQVWNTSWYDDFNDTSGTLSQEVSEITSTDSCDLNSSQTLSDYVEELEAGMGALTTGTVVINGNQVTVAGAIKNAVIDMTYTMPAFVASSFTAAMHGTVNVVDKAYLTIGDESKAIITLNGEHELLNQFVEPPSFKNANLVLDVTLLQGDKNDNGVSVADPVQFTGKIEAAAVKMPGKNWDDFDINPSMLKLSGAFSRVNSGQRFEAIFDANMSNANTFIPVDPLPIGHVRNDLVSYSFSGSDNILTMNMTDRELVYTFDSETGNVNLKTTYKDGWEYEYVLAMGVESLADYLNSTTTSSGGQPRWWVWVDCEGEYTVNWPASGFTDSSGVLPGKLSWSRQCDDEDETHWRDIQGELTLKAKFDNLPEATITANIDRTGYEAATGTITFAYEAITLTLSGDGNGASDEFNLNLLVTDTSSGKPARLTIYPDVESNQFKGSVVVNGNTVGTISEFHDAEMLIINYIDGSFETVTF